MDAEKMAVNTEASIAKNTIQNSIKEEEEKFRRIEATTYAVFPFLQYSFYLFSLQHSLEIHGN